MTVLGEEESARHRLFLRDREDLHADRRKKTNLCSLRERIPPDTTAALFWLKIATQRAGGMRGSLNTSLACT